MKYHYMNPWGLCEFTRVRIPLDPASSNGRTKKIVYRNFVKDNEFHRDLVYRLPDVLRGVREGLPIWWTEGEKDADTLADECELVATSHHGGAGHVSPGQARWLRGAARVFVLMDNDPPGHVDALMRRNLLIDAAGLSREQVVVLRARRPHKDVTDHIDAGFSTRQLVPVDIGQLERNAALADALSFRRHGYGWPR